VCEGFICIRIRTMEDSCEHSNERSGSIICRIIIIIIITTTTTTTHTLQINDNTATAEISKLKSLTVYFLCSVIRV